MISTFLAAILLSSPQFKSPPGTPAQDRRYGWGNANRAFVTVNGKRISESGVIRDNRVLVPMRPIFDALNVPVRWYPKNRKVVATRGNKIVSLIIGQNFAYNPQPVRLDYPPRIMNGRVMVPLRFVSETLGAQVAWDQARKTASVVLESPETVQ